MFLTPGAKLARRVDVNAALYNAVSSTRGEAAAATVIGACRAFQELRAALHEPPTTAVTERAIKRYLSALRFVVSEVKIPAAIPADLLWVNAFDGDDDCVVRDLAIDHVSALFNLGVCEATLATTAYRQWRTESEAKKTAVKHFCAAAGYFRAASDLPAPGGIRAVTCDLYPPTLRALEMVMLGNAQQTLYDITLESSNRSDFLARFAMGARDFYLIAEDCCREPDIVTTCINGYVGRPASALAAYFDVVAQSAQAKAAADSNDLPQQLARLSKAQKSADSCLNTVQSLETSALAAVTDLRTQLNSALLTLKQDIVARKSDADELNRICFVSPAQSVPEIESRRSVRAADVSGFLREESVDDRLLVFADLPEPLSAELSGLASTYSDLVASTVADSVSSINTAAAHLQEVINQVEGSVAAMRSSAALDTSQTRIPAASSYTEDMRAVAQVQYAQERGGLTTLRELQAQVFKLATETKLQIQSIDTLLHAEDADDRQLRARVHVNRPSSAVLAQPYIAKLTSIRRNLEQAANADQIVASQIDEHAKAITELTSIDLHAFVPPSAPGAVLQNTGELDRVESIVSELRPELLKGKEQLSQKDGIVRDLEKKKHLENPYAATVGLEDADVDKCTAMIEKEYGGLRQSASNACAEMTRISQFLTDGNARLRRPVSDGGRNSNAQARMNEVYKHQAAALKFKELMGHLEQGIHFYTKEQDVIEVLKTDIEGFVAARQSEAMDISSRSQYAPGGIPGYPPQSPYPPDSPQYPPGGPPYNPAGPYTNGPRGPPHTQYGRQPPYHGPSGAWRRQ